MIRPNHLIPPFNDPRARQALLYLTGDQTHHLAAMVGNRALEAPCWSVMVCGTPLGVDDGIGDWNRDDTEANLEKAKQLLAEAGYDGETIVLMDPTDFEVIHNMSIVTAQKLRDAGVNVDLQAMDWSTLTSRRPVMEAPDENPAGYHLFHTYSPGGYAADPLANGALGAACDQSNWFGWPCDEELEKMRLDFITVLARGSGGPGQALSDPVLRDGSLRSARPVPRPDRLPQRSHRNPGGGTPPALEHRAQAVDGAPRDAPGCPARVARSGNGCTICCSRADG